MVATMGCEMALSPSGRLRLVRVEEPNGAEIGGWLKRIETEFSRSDSAGLFALAATKPTVPISPSLSFWREFAALYLAEFCGTPEFSDDPAGSIELPAESECMPIILSAPPMTGGEYLSFQVLRDRWGELDAWVREEISSTGRSQIDWLREHAPIWHQVGRICFHLAENKREPNYPFAFMATYAPRISKGGKVQYQPLGKALKEYAGERNKSALVNLLSPIQRVSEELEFVRDLVDSGDIYHPLAWTPAEAYELLQGVPILEEEGVLVRLPDWWRKRPRARIGITIGSSRKGSFGVDAMLDCKVDLLFGDEQLTEEEWQQILSAEQGLVFLKGQWVEVDSEKLSSALAYWKKIEEQAGTGGISFIEGMRLLAGSPADLADISEESEDDREWSVVNAGGLLKETLSTLRDPNGIAGAEGRGGFRGTLRPYQQVGSNWLWFLASLGLGACLADDMGLGKTVQIISFLSALKGNNTGAKASLLVLPASLLSNWKSELRRFAPSLETLFIHPSETERSVLESAAEAPESACTGVDLVATTYGMLLRQGWLLEVSWRLVILDEAQAIKNPSTRQTRAVKKLTADARIALTGTPVENRLSDLWSLFDFLCPGLLGSAGRFKQFIKGLEARKKDQYGPLRNLVRPYILRRLKTDTSIITDLPDKTEMKAYCGLSKKQAALYVAAVETLAKALHGAEGIKRKGLVLSFLMKFKQICNHASQYSGDGEYHHNDSGKFDRLREICEEIASRQEKVLVFTQYREMTNPLAAFLVEVFRREGLILHGGTPVKKRKALIDQFQKEDGPPFFVLSLKAGGTGLNLTAASHVIHFDRWWNPAVENQATDRAFRIGQRQNVMVHKFVCRGTVEEKIDALIEEKSNLAEDLLRVGGESLLTAMGDEELLEVVALDVGRASL